MPGAWLALAAAAAVLQGCALPQPRLAYDPRFEQARLHLVKNELEAAVMTLETLQREAPDNIQYKNWLMLARDQQINQQLQRAERLLAQQDYAAALQAYQQLAEAHPQLRQAQEGLARCAQAQQHASELDEARAASQRHDWETSDYLLRKILSEQPAHVAARQLYERLQEMRSRELVMPPAMRSAMQQPVTLELKNTPLKQAFAFLGKAGQLNFSFDPDVSESATVSLMLRDVHLEQALEMLLTSQQLGKKTLTANTLMIYPQSKAGQYEELFVRSFYLSHLDAKKAMNLVKSVLRSGDLYIDEKLNTLVIRDTLEHIKVAEKLIASQDLNEPEVMLEVEVLEINRRNLAQLGLQYPAQVSVGVQGNAGASSAGTPISGQLSLTELRNFNGDFGVFSLSDPALVLNMLHQDTDTNLLASPKIRVKNRDKAKIHVGDKIPVFTSVANAQGFVSQNVNYIEVGIKLDVEPVIQMQDQVSIKVGMEVSNITDRITTTTGVLAFTIGSRNANTTLQLRNNETQILAGLFREDEQKVQRRVPGLAALPLLGRLFANDNNDKRKNEIVLLITPRILHNLTPANAVYNLIPAGTGTPTGAGNAGNNNAARSGLMGEPASAPQLSPEAVQADNVKADNSFANQLMNPTTPMGRQ